MRKCSTRCLHCQLGPIIQSRINDGISPYEIIGDLTAVLADMIASAPEGVRQTAIKAVQDSLPERVTAHVAELEKGTAAAARPAGATVQ